MSESPGLTINLLTQSESETKINDLDYRHSIFVNVFPRRRKRNEPGCRCVSVCYYVCIYLYLSILKIGIASLIIYFQLDTTELVFIDSIVFNNYNIYSMFLFLELFQKMRNIYIFMRFCNLNVTIVAVSMIIAEICENY